MRACFDAVTVNAARVMGLDGYGARGRLPRRLRAAAGARPGRGDPPARARACWWCGAARWSRAAPAGTAALHAARPAGGGGLDATALTAASHGPPGANQSAQSRPVSAQPGTPSMKLIGSLTSPYVRKVRIVMAEKKLDYQFELEDVWANDTILKSNPLGKVPCLVMEGGEAVFDSRVIVEYVDTLSPVSRLIPEGGRERTEVRTWEALADGVLDAAILARLEQTWAGRTDAQRSAAWIERQMRQGRRVARRDEHRPGRQALVHRHPLVAGRHRGRLRARLPRLPLPADRLARARTPTWPGWPTSWRRAPSFIDTLPPGRPDGCSVAARLAAAQRRRRRAGRTAACGRALRSIRPTLCTVRPSAGDLVVGNLGHQLDSVRLGARCSGFRPRPRAAGRRAGASSKCVSIWRAIVGVHRRLAGQHALHRAAADRATWPASAVAVGAVRAACASAAGRRSEGVSASTCGRRGRSSSSRLTSGPSGSRRSATIRSGRRRSRAARAAGERADRVADGERGVGAGEAADLGARDGVENDEKDAGHERSSRESRSELFRATRSRIPRAVCVRSRRGLSEARLHAVNWGHIHAPAAHRAAVATGLGATAKLEACAIGQ